MGLEMEHVVSSLADARCHEVFLCAICQGLANVQDCLVTTVCSHCFCRPCLQEWLTRRPNHTDQQQQSPFSLEQAAATIIPRCPTCQHDLRHSQNASQYPYPTMMMGDHAVTVLPLQKAQPLAHRVLQRIQVSCPLAQSAGCDWKGDYGDLQGHLLSKTAHTIQTTTNTTTTINNNSTTSVTTSASPAANFIRTTVGTTANHDTTEAMETEEPAVSDAEAAPDNDHAIAMEVERQQQQQLQLQAEALLQRRMDMATGFKEQANAQFEARQYRAARDLYTKALDILVEDSDDSTKNGNDDKTSRPVTPRLLLLATLLANRAATHLSLGNARSAWEDALAAADANPLYSKAYVRAARALVQQGDFGRATQVLQRGIQTLQQHEAEQNATTSTVRNSNSSSLQSVQKELQVTQRLEADLKQAQALLQQSDFASAKAVWGRLMQDTAAPNVVLGMAQADLGLGLVDACMRLTRQVLKHNVHSAQALALRGHCQVLMTEGHAGLALLKQAMRLDPDSTVTRLVYKQCSKAWTLRQQALDCIFNRKFQEAIPLLTQAMSTMLDTALGLPPKSPLYASLHTERAKAHLRLHEYEAALKDCALTVYHREDDVEAWLVRFQALHGLERHEEALDEVSSLLQKWGSQEGRIRQAYEKADFLVRKQKRPDFYAMLGVSAVASEREIKKAYRQASLTCHPDRLVGKSEAELKAAKRDFQLLGEGLEILTDDFKRQLYDEGYDPQAIKERVEAAQQAAHRNNYHGGHGGHGHHHHGGGGFHGPH